MTNCKNSITIINKISLSLSLCVCVKDNNQKKKNLFFKISKQNEFCIFVLIICKIFNYND